MQVVVKAFSIHPKDTEVPPCGVDDMTKLTYLHEPGVLDNLRMRYDINEFYVCISDADFPFTVLLKWGKCGFIHFMCFCRILCICTFLTCAYT